MSHPQLDSLRLMSPRSRLMQIEQMGVNKGDWAELLAMGEAAKMKETNGGDLAARMERLEAVTTFVARYVGLSRAFRVLDFSSEAHEMWCDRVLDRIRQPQELSLEEQYASLVGGNQAAEGWLREMGSNVEGRLEMLANCLESASGAPQ